MVEARATGCKIVATDVGVAREVGAKIVNDDPTAIAEVVVSELM
jgi:glycosyltransferase involved in cell wall biosynthesis